MKCSEFFNIGMNMYDNDLYEGAYEYFLEGALGDDPYSCQMLAVMYLNGYYPKQDFEKAFKFFRAANDFSEDKHLTYHSLYYLEEAYEEIEVNKKARELYKSFLTDMIENELWGFCISVAGEYGTGRIFPKDGNKQIEYYEMAAEHGIDFGYECLGELYFLGENTERDYKKAYEYFMKSKERTSNVKPYYMGEMYREGIIVEKDIEKAKEYYQIIANDERSKEFNDKHYLLAIKRLEEIKEDGC